MPVYKNLLEAREREDPHSSKQLLNYLDWMIEMKKNMKEEEKIAFYDKLAWVEK